MIKIHSQCMTTAALLFLWLGLSGPASGFYDPSIQRWFNRDPIGDARTGNLYCFAHNTPVIRSDAVGLFGLPLYEAALHVYYVCACANAIDTAMRTAENWANATYGFPGNMHADEGSVADMLTHCVGACEVAKSAAVCYLAGIDPRQYLQDREHGGVRPGDRMDLENNHIGFRTADRGRDCKLGCQQALATGELWTIDPKTGAAVRYPIR